VPIFYAFADILSGRQYLIFADILGGRQYYMILLNFVAANICVHFQYLLCIRVCANIFGAIVYTLGLRLIL
jgi:hypothetical protein